MSSCERAFSWLITKATIIPWFNFGASFSEQGRSSVHPVTEQPGGHGKGHGGDDRHRPQVMPEIFQSRSFEENPPDDGEKIPHRIEIGQGLHEVRHVGDRRWKAGERHCGDDKKKRAQQGLLQGGGERGNHQADADDRQDVDHQGRVERGQFPDQRHPEPVDRHQDDQRGLADADD